MRTSFTNLATNGGWASHAGLLSRQRRRGILRSQPEGGASYAYKLTKAGHLTLTYNDCRQCDRLRSLPQLTPAGKSPPVVPKQNWQSSQCGFVRSANEPFAQEVLQFSKPLQSSRERAEAGAPTTEMCCSDYEFPSLTSRTGIQSTFQSTGPDRDGPFTQSQLARTFLSFLITAV
ncbi:hypothetical protein BaRGS_00036895 [Batillaria attramentaria]|uniref:Uncharacterized protein n=1 Tax=Batillaria attramentaria TaxID=370345 RepID=A0ABD0JA57_9CAEN